MAGNELFSFVLGPVKGVLLALPHTEPSTVCSPSPLSQRWNLDGTGRFELPTTGLKLPNGQVQLCSEMPRAPVRQCTMACSL